MVEQYYCEPCQRLLVGNLLLRSDDEHPWEIQFDHHLDSASFEEAMRLPCSICTKAWTNSQKSPHEYTWERLGGAYRYDADDKERTLFFYTGHRNNTESWSRSLLLERQSSIAVSPNYRTLASNTSDGLDFLREQYKNCCAVHDRCSNIESVEANQYPRRLLDVGMDGGLIVLRTTTTFSNQQYVCLSHCWGESKPYTLNATTQQALESGIELETLPKTFKDAIRVARYLDISYLWIDSLCILQDSVLDWASESARMDKIYARAACTIAATASTNSAGGLFFERTPMPILPQLLDFHWNTESSWLRDRDEGFGLEGAYLCDVEYMITGDIENAPLNSRAWVSQERQLSRRTIHFSGSQLFWECHESITCETYPDGVLDRVLPPFYEDPTMLKRHLHECEQLKALSGRSIPQPHHAAIGWTDELYWAWCLFRVRYSASALTQAGDKLVALRGIAERVSSITCDELVAGLWKSRLPQELCWYRRMMVDRDLHAAHVKWRAPSWSWAAHDGSIWMSISTLWHRDHESQRSEIAVTGIDVYTQSSGEITHGSITIKCHPVPVTVHPEEMTQSEYVSLGYIQIMEDEADRLGQAISSRDSKIQSELNFDDMEFRDCQRAFLVVVQRCAHGDSIHSSAKNSVQDSDETLDDGGKSFQNDEEYLERTERCDRDVLEGLLLQMDAKDPATFSRIGMFFLERPNAIKLTLDAHCNAEERIIKLV